MRKLSKLLALALAVVLVLAMATTAFATEATNNGGTITITGATAGKTYSVYKIFDLTYSGTGTEQKVSYAIDSDWKDFFVGENALGASYLVSQDDTSSLSPVTVDNKTMYINITDSNVQEFAQTALAYATTLKKNDGEVRGAATGNTEIKNLALGYYLVYPQGAAEVKGTNGSICSLTSTVPNATVNVKAEYPTIDKTVDDADVEIGQTVTFTITGKVPDTTGYENYTYKVSDTMSTGLTFDKNSVKIYMGESLIQSDGSVNVSGQDPIYTNAGTDSVENNNVTFNDAAEGKTFTLSIDMTKYQTSNVGDDVVIIYEATVNEGALTTAPNNKAELTYSNGNEEETIADPPTVDLYTCQLEITKVDGKNNQTKLAGAEFQLYKEVTVNDVTTQWYLIIDKTSQKVTWVQKNDAGEWKDENNTTYDGPTTFVTGDDETNGTKGMVTISGIEAGDYFLVETKAPENYNKLADPVKVTLTKGEKAQNMYKTTQTVVNNIGSELPSTGGMGTTIFYVVGAVLVIGAGVLLVTKKRMNGAR